LNVLLSHVDLAVADARRMLWVLAVELGWVSVLLFWLRQTALNDDGEADSWAAPATAAVAAAAADDAAAPQVTMERSASQEMRVLLVSLQSVSPPPVVELFAARQLHVLQSGRRLVTVCKHIGAPRNGAYGCHPACQMCLPLCRWTAWMS
jgi:hypothetical protein